MRSTRGSFRSVRAPGSFPATTTSPGAASTRTRSSESSWVGPSSTRSIPRSSRTGGALLWIGGEHFLGDPVAPDLVPVDVDGEILGVLRCATLESPLPEGGPYLVADHARLYELHPDVPELRPVKDWSSGDYVLSILDADTVLALRENRIVRMVLSHR